MGSSKYLMLIFAGLMTYNMNIAAMDAKISSALIGKGAKVYKAMIGQLKIGVANMIMAEDMTKVAKTLLTMRIDMEKKQRDALGVIFKVNEESQLAIDAARVVVSKLKNICNDVIFILNSGKEDYLLKLGVQTFLNEAILMQINVAEAIDKLTLASENALKIDGELDKIDAWIKKKKEEISKMKDKDIKKARIKAYGPAAACILTGPWAIFACPIAYAVASGITEGKNVKEIQKAFDVGCDNIKKMRQDIEKIGASTKTLIQNVNDEKQQMEQIQTQLDKANKQGQLNLDTESYYNEFLATISDLYNACKAYMEPKSKLLLK